MSAVPSPSRRWLIGGAAAVALTGGAALGWRQSLRSSSGLDPALEAFWGLQLETPEGQPLALQALRGRPLLVNFWATWCPPCVRELPLINRFAQAQGAQGLQVLGLAVDKAENVQKWLARQPLDFPVALTGASGIALTRSLGNAEGGLPYSMLLDASGNVRQRKIGELSDADLQAWALG